MEIFNRVKFATATTGTSDIAVGARAQGYLTPALAGVGNGDVVPYFIEDGDNFAHGVGTYSTTGPTLARDAAEVSFNGTTYAAGMLSLSGTAFVFIGLAATEIPFLTDGMLGIGKVPVTLIDIEGTDADIRLKNTASGYYWELNTRNTGVFNIVSEQLGGNVIGLNGSGQFGIGSAVGSAGATAPRAAFDITESDSTVYNVGAGLDAFGEYGTMIVQNGSNVADTFTAISLYGGTNAAAIGHIALINEGGSGNFLSALAFLTRDSGGGVSEKARVHSNGYVGINEKAPDYRLDVNGSFGFSPGASVTPVDNGDVVFELTSNTAVTVKAKGSDSTVRSLALPLGGTIPTTAANVQASASTLTPDVDAYKVFRFTALAANLTINAPTGTPFDGQRIEFQFTDDGTERTLTWNSAFKAGSMVKLETSDPVLPDSTFCDDGFTPYRVFQKTVIFEYNSSRSAWIGVDAYKEDVAYDTITYVGGATIATSAGGTGSTSINSGLSGGSRSAVAAGDLVVVSFACSSVGNIDLSLTSSGYTKISPELYADDTDDTNLAIFYKFMDSTPDTSVGWDASGGAGSDSYAVSVRVYEGVDQSSPMDVTPTTATGTDTGQPDPAAITPITSGAVIVIVGASSGDSLADTNSTTGYQNPSYVSVANHITLGVGHKAWSSGAYNPAVLTGSTATSLSWAAFTLALRPASLN